MFLSCSQFTEHSPADQKNFSTSNNNNNNNNDNNNNSNNNNNNNNNNGLEIPNSAPWQ